MSSNPQPPGATGPAGASSPTHAIAPSYETIYAIFQGGGAKGITHVGALKALEEEHLVSVGLAGTSAGAIIAALAAVGYKADEILNPDTKTTILGDKSPIHWLGPLRWIRFLAIRRLGAPVAIMAAIALIAVVLGLGVMWFKPGDDIVVDIGLCVFVAAALVLGLLFVPPVLGHGLFPSVKLRDLINQRLREKLAEHYKTLGLKGDPPKVVTFADIDPVAVSLCRALKVVASDVRGRQLILFDAATPGVAVADAVVASAAIPFAFAPPKVRGSALSDDQVFADGGLVSNLPSWVFSVEKRAFERQQQGPPIPIMAFTLPPDKPTDEQKNRGLSFTSYIGDVIETGIFSSQKTVEQFVPDLQLIELPTPLSTFAFDCSWEEAKAAYMAGYDKARGALRLRRRERQLTNGLLAEILAAASDDIAKRRAANGIPMPRLRMCLVDPSGPKSREASEFRVVASTGMQADADDRLPVDPRNHAAPKAFKDRSPVFASIAGATAQALWMTKYEHALVWPALSSVIAIPVFGRPPKQGAATPPTQRVLCLDSADSLRAEFDDPTFMDRLVRSSFVTSATLISEQLET